MYTRQQIEEIRKGLTLYTKKDSDFETALLPLTGREEVVFTQNGKNVKLPLIELLNELIVFRASDFINLTEGFDRTFTIEEALEYIPLAGRKVGMVITFINTETNEWVLVQYRGKTLAKWFDFTYWKVLEELDNYPIKEYTKAGTSEERPVGVPTGFQYFDSELGLPIFWNGESWVDSAGTIIE